MSERKQIGDLLGYPVYENPDMPDLRLNDLVFGPFKPVRERDCECVGCANKSIHTLAVMDRDTGREIMRKSICIEHARELLSKSQSVNT